MGAAAPIIRVPVGVGFLDHLTAILIGTLMGSLGRLLLLHVDYRQYPSYPQAYVVHLAFGFVAAFLGSIAVPAIVAKEFAAASFLALAVTQFREVRKIERETLERLEKTELVPRGTAYIEGIAKTFEARNYLAMLVGLVASLGVQIGRHWEDPALAAAVGILFGLATIVMLKRSITRAVVGDIAHVRPAEISFDGPLLVVEGVQLMNIGLPESRQTYLEQGLAVAIIPKSIDAKATLGNIGQRQAIVHDAATLCGVRMDVADKEFMPLARRDLVSGVVALVIVPAEKNMEALITAVRQTPVLEDSVRKPSEAEPSKIMA
jgi:hypothetical protein